MYRQRVLGICTTFALLLGLFGGGQPALAQSDIAAPAASTGSAAEAAEAAAAAKELLVFEVNRQVTKSDHGFPWDKPPRAAANGNWYSPVNFAEGVFHFRVEIRSQPRPQDMRLQFCIWQYRNRLENCTKAKPVRGNPGTVVTWSQPVQSLWKKNGRIIDWRNPRDRNGLAIKNSDGKPVSDFAGWNWNGENPNLWYPLNMRFTVVVVAKGATFGGWGRYTGNASAATSNEEILELDAATLNDPNYGSGLEAFDQESSLFLPLVTR